MTGRVIRRGMEFEAELQEIVLLDVQMWFTLFGPTPRCFYRAVRLYNYLILVTLYLVWSLWWAIKYPVE